MRLENVTALVTGAGSGIGEAVCSRFRREGARLLLTGRRGRLGTAEPEDLYVPGNLNDETFVADLARQAAESLGSIDECHREALDALVTTIIRCQMAHPLE